MIPDTIIQKPTTKGNEAAVSAGFDKSTKPNRISISPPASAQPQLGIRPLLANEAPVCTMPVSNKLMPI